MITSQAVIWVGGAYLLAALVGYAGYRVHALSPSGAIAACVVGGTVFGFGGLAWATVLVAFFASSSLLSFFKASDARKIEASATFEKGGRRDGAQVLANGGVAAILAVLSIPFGGATLPYLYAGFVGALAAATADTWATEIGVLSKARPRLLTTGRKVDAGTSGAVTVTGIGAAFAGALFLGIVGMSGMNSLSEEGVVLLPYGNEESQMKAAPALIMAALAGGLGGSMLDSLLGATLQSSYRCPRCGKATESRIHRCGTPAQLIRGIAAVNNDVVNFMATLAGALLGALAYWALGSVL